VNDDNKKYDNLRTLWNEDASALQRQSKTGAGRAAIWFANTLGGGAYGSKQRAILGDPVASDIKGISERLDY